MPDTAARLRRTVGAGQRLVVKVGSSSLTSADGGHLDHGALSALAGLIVTSRLSSAQPTAGMGYELDAIASCIVGGCSIAGGVGTVGGVFAGVIIFNVISYGLTFIGISPYWQNVVKGLIIIGAVALDVRKYSAKK